ncbi:DNA mismatch repair endonuclease MutL [Fervidobacterium thailandense]|nr:DNA mismatch repair endonuclease MutL [Fervidobacterium thailandense]
MKEMKIKIKRLPDEVISKIAAGEVVTNPASVVKELVENSVDARASKIEIQIRNGGKSYIKVSDNGIGMSTEELTLAVQRYTTSKIETLEDIYKITSFGFRGEALASIAEVSRLLITSSNGEVSGKLEVVGGKVVRISEAFRERGTTVEVYDLFFNVPARRKFLSSEKVEARMVTEMVERFLVALPSVEFLYKIEDEVVYFAKPSRLSDRFSTVFPEVREFREFEEETSFGKVRGVISSPQYCRKNRTGQMFFVNGRFVLDSLLNSALERGYGESISHGGKPYAVIFLEISPDRVDVNIHPQKLQVKFSDAQGVYNEIIRVVRDQVRKFPGFTMFVERPTSDLSSDGRQVGRVDYADGTLSDIGATLREGATSVSEKSVVSRAPDSAGPWGDVPSTLERPIFKTVHSVNQLPYQAPYIFADVLSTVPANYLIVKERYVIFEDVDGLAIMDFHAAHERLIFEKLKTRQFSSSRLLIPVEIRLSKSMLDTLRNLERELEALGFEFSMENDLVKVTAIPSLVKVTEVKDILTELLDDYRLPFDKPETVLHALASKACKAAVKTGDKLTGAEIEQLLKEVRSRGFLTCPHGRPIVMKIKFSELDNFFGR